MGNYLQISDIKGTNEKLKKIYEKHLKLNKIQFLNDFGQLNSFEDVFTFNKSGSMNFYELKTGVLERNFYTTEFIQDVNKLILDITIDISLISQDNGYRDYDVKGCNGIYRACVGFNIKKGDIFNVYCFEHTKLACVYDNDLRTSLINFASSDSFNKEKIK
jgi:hypothetical protein